MKIIYHIEGQLMSITETVTNQTAAVIRLVELSKRGSIRFLIYAHQTYEIRGFIRRRQCVILNPSHGIINSFKYALRQHRAPASYKGRELASIRL